MISIAGAMASTAASACTGVTLPTSSRFNRNATSGSTRGWTYFLNGTGAPSSTTMSLASRPQIMSKRPICTIFARLVKPIFMPTRCAPAARRRSIARRWIS